MVDTDQSGTCEHLVMLEEKVACTQDLQTIFS